MLLQHHANKAQTWALLRPVTSYIYFLGFFSFDINSQTFFLFLYIDFLISKYCSSQTTRVFPRFPFFGGNLMDTKTVLT